MHNVTAPKSDKLTIERISNAEALASVRKASVKPGHAFRDKRNDYRRKPKFFAGW